MYIYIYKKLHHWVFSCTVKYQLRNGRSRLLQETSYEISDITANYGHKEVSDVLTFRFILGNMQLR